MTGVAASVAMCGMAAPISPEAALKRVGPSAYSKGSDKSVNAELAFGRYAAGEPAVYVFNNPDSHGFMVVSADDELPALLGYSDRGAISAEEQAQPDGLRYWLDMLTAQVEYARNASDARGVLLKSRPAREEISPMCTTEWNQSDPFNNECPEIGGQRSVTGCVATAMAQAMKYHNWPASGEGASRYEWNGNSYSCDFSTIEFDWENMRDVYQYNEYTDAEAEAVARLMYAAGMSVDMRYSPWSSGASSMLIAPALGNNFRYDKSRLEYHLRDYYSLYEWEEMIYTSLKEYGPVIYGGQSTEGGHSFICDGYRGDGYFHFNWGWGGLSDGWFLLDALDPLDQGIGGSVSLTGFNYDQDIVTGLTPDLDGTSVWCAPSMVTAHEFAAYFTKYSNNPTYMGQISISEQILNSGLYYNIGPADLSTSGAIGLKLTPLAGGDSYYTGTYVRTTLAPGVGYKSMNINLQHMPAGDYLMTFVYAAVTSPEVEWLDAYVPLYDSPGWLVSVTSDGNAYIDALATPGLDSDNLVKSGFYLNTDFNVSLDMVNSSERPYYGEVVALLLNKENQIIASSVPKVVDLEANETRELDYTSHWAYSHVDGVTSLEAGDYNFVMATTSSNYYIPMTDIEPVTVYASQQEGTETGVEEINEGLSEGENVYYDLNGLRVINPERGRLLIRRGARKAEILK